MIAAVRSGSPAADPADEAARSATPLFLVHFAPGDDNVYLRMLFADLQATVFGRLGRDSANVGWLAQAGRRPEGAPRAGQRPETSAVVLTCPVLVVLYSKTYLRDERCLREWSLFRERVRWHRRLTGRSTPALVGVRWSLRPGSEGTTIVAGDVLHGDFGPCYNANGALQLLRRNPSSTAHDNLVRRVGDLVAAGAHDPPPTISEQNLKYIDFSPRPGVSGGGAQPATAATLLAFPGRRTAGPPGRAGLGEPAGAAGPARATPRGDGEPPGATSSVGIIVVAPTVADLPARRTARDCYGESAADWRPFHPRDPRPAVEIARDELTRNAFPRADLYAFEPETITRLDEASQDQIVLLLVDPWSALSDADMLLLRRFRDWQARRPTVAGALVVFAAFDGETTRAAGELRTRLRASMEYHSGQDSRRRLSDEVGTPDQLARSAVRLVTRARNALLPLRAGGPGRRDPAWYPPAGQKTRNAVPGRTAEE
jgi:FxsC-like protein